MVQLWGYLVVITLSHLLHWVCLGRRLNCRLAIAGVSTTGKLKSKKSKEREGSRRGSSWSKVW